jgi:glycosyltransferase involved in cell wall biosynthesis
LVSRFIAVSEHVRSVHIAGGFAADKLHVKYNGVQLPAEAAQMSSRCNRVVFAGRMSPSKGTTMVGDLIGKLTKTEFHLVGSGPELAALQERASKYSHVHVHGRIERLTLLELMRSARCVIVPSTFPEPFGLTAVEAMAMGTPVVASRIGGLTELVEGSQGGILVNVEEGASGFARAINTLLADPQLARRLGENGREFAQTKCSPEVTTRQLIEIYDDVCQTAQRPAAVAVT